MTDPITPDTITPDTITPDMIAAAERLMGVAYTATERQQMLGNLDEQIAQALARRRVPMANSVPMATRFDPRLPGFAMPYATDLLRLSPSVAALPESDEDIAFAAITDLSAWIAAGALTSTRLTQIYLDRIAALNPALEC